MKDLEENNKSKNQFLNDLYDDFFYLISSNPEEFDSQKKNSTNSEIPKIEIQNENIPQPISMDFENSPSSNIDKPRIKTLSEEEKNTKMKEFLERIENSYLTPDSKIEFKKILHYVKKFNDGIVKNYIPFNMRIYCDNDETLYSIVNIIVDSFVFFNYMPNSEIAERSFFIIEEANHITDLYSSKSSFVIFKDPEGLLNKEKNIKDKLLNVLETSIINYSNVKGTTTIISDSSKAKIDELFANNVTIKDKIFDFELFTTTPDKQEVYQSILSSLRKDYILTGEFEITLIDYVSETYAKTNLSAPEYINSTIEKILFNQTANIIDSNAIPKFEKNKSIDEIFQDLNELIGLTNIKQMLKDLVNFIKFKNKSDSYLKIKDTNLHMVFLGNPGTGKTTVARMIAGILYNLNYIEQNKLIEVSAKDLIGQYVGQTAPKTMAVIEKALGGVLFIDEAYSLSIKPDNNSFNEECISTLIQAMENYRDNLVVIFAGYSKEMDAFLKSNSGIVSRIGYTFEFADYTTEELIQILKSMFKKSGFIIDDNAIEKSKQIIEEFRNTEGFGNARFIRNLYEKSIIKHATNTLNKTSQKALKTITVDDITSENLSKL